MQNQSETTLLSGDAYLEELDAVLSYGPAVAIVWRLQDGWPVEFVTPNITQFGYEPEQLLSGSLPWSDLVHPDDLQAVASQVSGDIAAGKVHSTQRYRIRTADGAWRWLADYTTFVRDREGTARIAQGVLIDVTERVSLEEQAQQFVGQHPGPMFAIDTQGNIGITNPAAERMLVEIAHASRAEQAKFEALKSDWRCLSVPSQGYFALSDRVYWFHLTPSHDKTLVYAVGVEVTHEREQQRLLEAIKNQTSEILYRYWQYTDGTDSIEIINPERLVELNLVAASDHDNQGQILKALWGSVLPEDIEGLRRSIALSVNDLSPWTYQWRTVDLDGVERWIRGRGNPQRHTDGSTSWLVIARDMTSEKHQADALAGAMEETIGVLADAVEMRDSYTAGHQRHVALLSGAIARELGLEDHAVKGIHLAAAVHDIGKIRVPIEILGKPDRLSAEEMLLVREHSAMGAELLERVKAPWPIAKIVRQHHERMDGSGYPDGLPGEQILLEARIIAVADVFESISSARPYRPARGMTVAMQELERGRGKIYDSDVVDALSALVARGEVQLENEMMIMPRVDLE